MEVTSIITEEDAVSSTIGVVLMVAVTVVLAAAVGSFALGLSGESTKETPSASVDVEWGVQGSDDTVDITIRGGDTLRAKFVTVKLGSTVVWNDAQESTGGLVYYDQKMWDADKIRAGDTLGLKESGTNINNGDQLQVIWNNGEKSQVLGSGTAP